MAEVGDGIAAIAVGCHFVETLVLVAQPVVALRVTADAIEAAEGFAVAVVCQYLLVALLVDDKQRMLLVAYQQLLVVRVVEECTRLVLQHRLGIGHHQLATDGVLQYLQLLQAAAAR